MTSIHYNIPNDGENSVSQMRCAKMVTVNSKEKNLKTPNSKIPKRFKDTPRTFGDISNRIDRSVHKNASIYVKGKATGKTVNQPRELLLKKNAFNSPFPEHDFRPDIHETEDYGDILPEKCVLTKNDINKFSKFWKGKSFSSTAECRPLSPSPPPPPPPPLQFLSLKERKSDKSRIDLSPVPDEFLEVFEVPPPFTLN